MCSVDNHFIFKQLTKRTKAENWLVSNLIRLLSCVSSCLGFKGLLFLTFLTTQFYSLSNDFFVTVLPSHTIIRRLTDEEKWGKLLSLKLLIKFGLAKKCISCVEWWMWALEFQKVGFQLIISCKLFFTLCLGFRPSVSFIHSFSSYFPSSLRSDVMQVWLELVHVDYALPVVVMLRYVTTVQTVRLGLGWVMLCKSNW